MSDSAENGDELFDPADFESIELQIFMKNTATGKTLGDESKIAIIEVGDQALTLSIPAGSFAAGTHVMLEIYRGENLLLHSTAKIKSASESSVGSIGIWAAQLELLQFEAKTWEDFLKIFSKRQEEISSFFELGKH